MDYSPPGSSVHGSFQARILEWVPISFSRDSSQPRDQTLFSCVAGRFFPSESPEKPKSRQYDQAKLWLYQSHGGCLFGSGTKALWLTDVAQQVTFCLSSGLISWDAATNLWTEPCLGNILNSAFGPISSSTHSVVWSIFSMYLYFPYLEKGNTMPIPRTVLKHKTPALPWACIQTSAPSSLATWLGAWCLIFWASVSSFVTWG